LVGAVLQFFLAGLGVFRAASFSPHITVGTLLGIMSLILVILAVLSVLTSTLSRRSVTLATLLFALMVLQWLLVEVFLGTVPALAALHPVNGLLIVAVAYALATGQRRPQPAERRRARV
jgi:hypothetical protein